MSCMQLLVGANTIELLNHQTYIWGWFLVLEQLLDSIMAVVRVLAAGIHLQVGSAYCILNKKKKTHMQIYNKLHVYASMRSKG